MVDRSLQMTHQTLQSVAILNLIMKEDEYQRSSMGLFGVEEIPAPEPKNKWGQKTLEEIL